MTDIPSGEYSGAQELLEIELGLPKYNLAIAKAFYGFIRADRIKYEDAVLDFGAGIGTIAQIMRSQFGINPFCLEIDTKQVQKLAHSRFTVMKTLQEVNEKKPLKFIYTSNVLEHIEDDSSTLKEMYQALADNGRLAIFVPSLPILFSDLDRKVGHFRRYKKSELKRKVVDAGFVIESCHYWDCLGVLAGLIIKFLGFKKRLGIGSVSSLVIYDRVVFPVSRILDRLGFRFLFGKNLILKAKKTT